MIRFLRVTWAILCFIIADLRDQLRRSRDG